MRCNTGVDPAILMDQHLIAEYRELLIPVGQLKKLDWRTPPIPSSFSLGKGHITFWRDKQLYLKRRHDALILEMRKRLFKPNYSFWDLKDIPKEFCNDWEPSYEDSLLIRERIWSRIVEKPSWYRFWGHPLDSKFLYKIFKDQLFDGSLVY